jgi:hypothetical protein
MITEVFAGGFQLDAGQILATVTVLHGRQGFGEEARPMSATITVEHPPGSMPSWRSGDFLMLSGDHGPMFSGRIVQRALAHRDLPDGTRVGQFTVTAAGPLAALNGRKIGDVPWPQESGTARATRILQAAQVPWAVDGTVDLLVLPRDVDAQPAGGLLDALAADTSAAVFDVPHGEVVYQALSARARPVIPFRWQDFTDTETWGALDPAVTWDGNPPSMGDWTSPTSTPAVILPATVIEWEPEWSSSEATVINHVTIGWGPLETQDMVDLVDDASIDQHGERYLYAGTQLADAGSATTRATHILTTQHEERWEIGDVTVNLDHLDPATYQAVLGLLCGDAVTLQGLPQPAPATDWTGIVEGWTYTQVGHLGTLTERITLNLSDPLHSLQVMVWDDYPSLYLWDDHPNYVTWDDLTDADILEAA